jgi:hypothetical protein
LNAPEATFSDEFDFSPPKTFTWLGEHPLKYSADAPNPFLEQYLMDATRALLESRGYSFVENSANPDFAIAFSLGSREKIAVSSYPGYGGHVGVGRRGYWRGAHVGGTTARSYTEGQIGIDVFDVASKKPAWHATDTRTLKSLSGEELREEVAEQVELILREFPPVN